jgi:hypothetical protein
MRRNPPACDLREPRLSSTSTSKAGCTPPPKRVLSAEARVWETDVHTRDRAHTAALSTRLCSSCIRAQQRDR